MISKLSTTVALLGAIAACPSQAATTYVLDTGEPADVGWGYTLMNHPAWGVENQLGVQLVLAAEARIDVVEIFGFVASGGDLTVSLWNGAPTLQGSPVATYTAQVLPDLAVHWVSVGGMDWQLQAGTYALTFEAGLTTADSPNLSLGATPDAPSPAGAHYFYDAQWADWERLNLSFGVRAGTVTAPVPEPAAWALMAIGLMVGAAVRGRQPTAALH